MLSSLLFLGTSISRLSFLRQAGLPYCYSVVATSALSFLRAGSSTAYSTNQMQQPISLLESVYGRVDSPDFPLPMPVTEAGLCTDGYQRRYLWTDAFGVLALISVAERYEQQNMATEAKKYRSAADILINTVHKTLGVPSQAGQEEFAMLKDPSSPTGYVGLRIGKVESRKVTDCGMHYDGQYWHYVDKWLFALERAGHANTAIGIAKSCFKYFFDQSGGGIRWKLSVDSTPPPALQHASTNSDTLSALIVFSLLERHDEKQALKEEIDMLQTALTGYQPRVTDDPLGWGLELFYNQFLQGHPQTHALVQLQSSALHPSHMSLPFRLYGAMIGAWLAGLAESQVNSLIDMALSYENKITVENEDHSSINRVMLAMCLLCPGTMGRRQGDPVVGI